MNQLITILSDYETYGQTKPYRNKIIQGDQTVMKKVQDVIVKILSEPYKPIQKLLAIKFAMDCIESFNDDFISQFQVTVLPQMECIASFDKGNNDDQRGIYFFSSNPDMDERKISNSFFRMTLECLWVWSKWFPVDPETQTLSLYKLAFQRLVHKKVHFMKLQYFTLQDVIKFLPEQSAPRKLLKESNIAIEEDYTDTNEVGSDLITLQSKLFCTLDNGVITDVETPVSLLDLFKDATLRIIEQNKNLVSHRVQKSKEEVQYIQANQQQNYQPQIQTQGSCCNSQTHILMSSDIQYLQTEVENLHRDNKSLRQSSQFKDEQILILKSRLQTQANSGEKQ